MTKASWTGKGLLSVHFHIIAPHSRQSGQELEQGGSLEAGADAEVREEAPYCLGTQDYLFRNGTTHNSWVLLHPSLRKCPTGLSTAGSCGGIFLRIPPL